MAKNPLEQLKYDRTKMQKNMKEVIQTSLTLCGDQATHFVGCTKSPNAPNSYNRIKINNTFEAGPTMRVSFVNERKSQVGWVVIVGHRTQK